MFRIGSLEASRMIDERAETSQVTALTAPQTQGAIRRFGALGLGPRIYDYLIGTTAETYGADTIVTWNTRDFEGLFPALRIVTPINL